MPMIDVENILAQNNNGEPIQVIENKEIDCGKRLVNYVTYSISIYRENLNNAIHTYLQS